MKVKKTRRIKQSPKLPAETRRYQLLKAAHKLFDKKGYRATTLDEIAHGAGLTKGAVYHHFKNKEAILLELTHLILNAYKDGVRDLPKGSLRPGDLILHLKEIDEGTSMHKARYNMSLLVEVIKVKQVRQTIEDGYEEFLKLCDRCLDPSLVRSRKMIRQITILTVNFYDGLCWGAFMYPTHIDFDKQASLFASLFNKEKSDNMKAQRAK
ncbi:MAG: hypothetical protein DRP47_01410 [Candidatus Zixiibacteriota bacterium]|nr:MAG: hypothetical protein DRP47_01410 [candidate division Zixibacteria bacterium]